MGTLQVRNLDDAPIARPKARVARRGRSTKAEHREILLQTLSWESKPGFADLAARMRQTTAGREQAPAAALLYEDRNAR